MSALLDSLTATRDQRTAEVAEYDFNIANFEDFLANVDNEYAGDDETAVFMRTDHKARVERLLADHRKQRAIAQSVLDSVTRRLAATEAAGG